MHTYTNARRNMLLIILFVILMGIGAQLARSQMVFRLTNPTNDGPAARKIPAAASAAWEADGYTTDKFLIIYDEKEELSAKLAENLAQTIHYMKKEYDTTTVQRLGSISGEYRAVIAASSIIDDSEQWQLVEDYVEKGGRLFFAVRPELDQGFLRIYRKLGIYSYGSLMNTEMVQLTSNVLIKGDGQTFNDPFLANSSLFVSLEDRCRVYARTVRQTPLLWEASYGQGSFMVYNGVTLYSRINRGMIAGAISKLLEDETFIYPVMNMKLAFIDDFPAPFPKGRNEALYAEYGRDNTRFFREIWWPDMLKTSKQENLKYTGALIENYNDWVKSPFSENPGSDREGLITYGRELLKNGGELGIHGYNHQSLETKTNVSSYFGYNVWKSEKDMEDALKEVNRFTKSVFSKYEFRTYVPPSNVLSPEGREAIRTASPDIRILSSIYLEDPGSRAYVQEFEVGKDGMIELPRITSGYEFSVENRWAVMNTVTSIGVFSHFVHPDDILDSGRNGNKSWKELSREYSEMMGFVNSKYSWLKPMTATGGAEQLESFAASWPAFKQEDGKLSASVAGFVHEADFILRTDKKIGSLHNCSVTQIDKDVYLVHAVKANFELGLEGSSS